MDSETYNKVMSQMSEFSKMINGQKKEEKKSLKVPQDNKNSSSVDNAITKAKNTDSKQ